MSNVPLPVLYAMFAFIVAAGIFAPTIPFPIEKYYKLSENSSRLRKLVFVGACVIGVVFALPVSHAN